MKPKPKVYSYIRFSSKEQAEGTSAIRQLEFAERWAEQKAMPLDTTLRDEGLSGYHGDHITAGALGRFLELVRMNRVAKGSVLVVETEDRLGRLPIEVSLPIFFQIINADITLVFAQDSSMYDKKTVRDNQMVLLKPIMKMILAYEESHQKSIRIKDARDRYRKAYHETDRRLTAMAPMWLTLNDARDDWEVNTQLVRTIEQVHQWYLDGKSAPEITRILNTGPSYPKIPPKKKKHEKGEKPEPPRSWRIYNVRSVLGDPRLIGHYQFHLRVKKDPENPSSKMIRVPIGGVLRDYYPVVIDEGYGKRLGICETQTGIVPARAGVIVISFIICSST